MPLLNTSLPIPTTLVVDGETNPFTLVKPKRVKTRANFDIVGVLYQYTVFGVAVMNTHTILLSWRKVYKITRDEKRVPCPSIFKTHD